MHKNAHLCVSTLSTLSFQGAAASHCDLRRSSHGMLVCKVVAAVVVVAGFRRVTTIVAGAFGHATADALVIAALFAMTFL